MPEFEVLLAGTGELIFDAYVNIGSLANEATTLRKRYPHAKFIIASSKARPNR
jgi:hypothetical protein